MTGAMEALASHFWGIGLVVAAVAALVLFWVTVRFLGPALGWWTLADG